jgi:hypothetical protein
MAYSERALILSEAEQDDFYGNPLLTNNDQRYFFALNDKERKVANQFRARHQRCMFVVLLGYFKEEDGDKQSLFKNSLVADIWGEEVVKDFYASYPDVRESLYEGPESFYQQYNFGDLSKFRDSFLVNIKNAYDAGVLVAGGSDSPLYPSLWVGETMHRELELFVMAGITPIEAIMMCSYNGAKILKKEDQFGSLQSGISADILIVKGKPWENISDTRNIEQVFVRGQLLNRKKLLTSWR